MQQPPVGSRWLPGQAPYQMPSSDAMQIRESTPSRTERVTRSCGECRRRKQKCNQGHPCSNCSRRFPQPVCEYKQSSKRHNGPSASSRPTFVVTLPDTPNNDDYYLGIRGIRQPLLPAPLPVRAHASRTGAVVRWSGVDILTEYPGDGASPMAMSWTSDTSAFQTEAFTDCDEACQLHSDAVHDAFRLLKARRMIPDRFIGDSSPRNMDDFFAWLRIVTWTSKEAHDKLYQMNNSPTSDLAHLPISPTRLNAELIRIYVKLISRFKACLDGNPDSSNPYIKFYVPYCIQTPLLAQVAIYTSACFLNETGHLDKMVAMSHKGQAIRMLNEHLRSESSTSDEAVTAVIQLIMDEWYWGETGDLRAHLRGLREMIRLRGGLRQLGMNGMISKLAIASDSAIALSFEIPPFLQNGSGFDFQEPMHTPFRVAYNTPLVSPLVSFAKCAEALDIHPATASILDDMRFMIATVLSLPPNPAAKDLHKVHTTSAWIHDRILNLPEDSPEAQEPSQADPEAPVLGLRVVPVITARVSPGPPGISSAASKKQQQQRPRQQPTPPGSTEGSQKDARRGGVPKIPSAASSPGQKPTEEERKEQGNSRPLPSSPRGGGGGDDDEAPDALYQAVRQTALIYCQAITQRRSFGAVVSPAEFVRLWTTTWRVSLSCWKSLLGIFMWITLSIIASARDTPHDRFVKSMLSICTVQMSLESWDVAGAALKAALNLNAWLRDGENARAGAEDGDDVAEATASADDDEDDDDDDDDDDGRSKMKREKGGEGGAVVLDFDAQGSTSTKFSGGGKTIREKGSTMPGWDA